MDPVIRWLLGPLSGADHHQIEAWTYWHARLMVVSWGVLLPGGMIVARFFKVQRMRDWPERLDRKLWWRTHVALQSLGVALMTLGLVIAYGRGGGMGGYALLHHLMGWTVVLMGWSQMLGGALRGTKGGPTDAAMRGDHYDMTRRRVIFEYIHKGVGWATMPLVVMTTALGLIMVDAPRWMPLLIGGWWLALIVAFVRLQRAGRCIDTYQAIWGSDPTHPGNTRKPIGWGVRRP